MNSLLPPKQHTRQPKKVAGKIKMIIITMTTARQQERLKAVWNLSLLQQERLHQKNRYPTREPWCLMRRAHRLTYIIQPIWGCWMKPGKSLTNSSINCLEPQAAGREDQELIARRPEGTTWTYPNKEIPEETSFAKRKKTISIRETQPKDYWCHAPERRPWHRVVEQPAAKTPGDYSQVSGVTNLDVPDQDS